MLVSDSGSLDSSKGEEDRMDLEKKYFWLIEQTDLVVTCLLDLNVWVELEWIGLVFLGFVTDWLGKVSFSPSPIALVNWPTYISN